jgi:hypothetical protein
MKPEKTPDSTKAPAIVFYTWYTNACVWDTTLGWIPGYPTSGRRDELRIRRLAKQNKDCPSLVQKLLSSKTGGYEMCDQN